MSIVNLTDALLGDDTATILSIVDNVGYIKTDGTVSMSIGYVPTLALQVATKGYVDDLAATKQSVSEKGQVNGYCPLGASALVPADNLPDRVENIVAGSGIVVNDIDPLNPIVSAVPTSAAGLLSRIYATGDTVVLTSGTYYVADTTTGTVASVEQTIAVDDNAKAYFAQDYISDANTEDTTYYAGTYAGTLTVKTSDATDQQRFTVEIYKADVNGTVIDSGLAGEVIGDLGVKPLAVLTTGVIDLPASVLVNAVIDGTLTEQVTLLTTQRIRFHVSGEKIGTIGGIATLSFFGGYDRSSYIDIPVAVTTDSVINKSIVPGATASDAIDSLSTSKAPLTGEGTSGTWGISITGSAALLNGQAGSYYLSWANFTGTPTTLTGYGITDAAHIDTAQTFTAAQRTSITAEDNAIDFTANNNFTLTATAANITLTSATGCTGQSGVIVITSSENITGWGTEFLFTDGAGGWSAANAPTVTGIEIFAYFVQSPTAIRMGRVQ